jgi:hypothetical protein
MLESFSAFLNSVYFGITAMVIVGSSWCLVGLVMGDAPKKNVDTSMVQFFGAAFSCLVSLILWIAAIPTVNCSLGVLFLACGVYAMGTFLNFYMLQFMSAAMQLGPNGVIWSIIQSAFIFPFIGGIVFFDLFRLGFQLLQRIETDEQILLDTADFLFIPGNFRKHRLIFVILFDQCGLLLQFPALLIEPGDLVFAGFDGKFLFLTASAAAAVAALSLSRRAIMASISLGNTVNRVSMPRLRISASCNLNNADNSASSMVKSPFIQYQILCGEI